MAMCKEMGIKVVTEKSHTLYDLNKVIEANDGKAPSTYRQFINIISSMKPPAIPVPNVCSKVKNCGITPISEDHDDLWGVPTLAELGFDTNNIPPPKWIGGETEALNRLDRHLERKAWVASFGKPKMTPQSLYASPAGLSPYLRFGCLSTRLFYHMLAILYRKIKETPPPMSTFGQLLWREFFYTASTKNPNFDRMVGNPICVQIPWEDNPEALAKWASGKTGFPWIDAIMTQLREEGWIHQVARHSVACFLTRGHLWISWVEGMKVFDELLLDADWSVNAGSWMWLSCSSFFTQFFPLFDPVRFGRKADANGDFIRRYLPVLKNFPTRYIHEPWTAPDAVQRSAKCIIGQDYPKPMCNHEYVSKLNMERMKAVYSQLAHYRRTGQTGPGIPHELLAQMKKIPKIPGEVNVSGGTMGPPNVPDNRKHFGIGRHHTVPPLETPEYVSVANQNIVNSSYSGNSSMMVSYDQQIYPNTENYNTYSNFTSLDTADSLPVISGDILLPGPLSSTGEMSGGANIGSVGDRNVLMDGAVVEGGSTISNLSIMSQPGSVEHLHSLSPMHNINTSQDDLNANSSLVELDNYGTALAEGFFDSSSDRCQN